MNHGTILQQNSRGLAHEMIIAISVCLIHKQWNNCPLAVEGSMCDDCFFFAHVGLAHEPWNHPNHQMVWWGSLIVTPIIPITCTYCLVIFNEIWLATSTTMFHALINTSLCMHTFDVIAVINIHEYVKLDGPNCTYIRT